MLCRREVETNVWFYQLKVNWTPYRDSNLAKSILKNCNLGVGLTKVKKKNRQFIKGQKVLFLEPHLLSTI